MLPRISIDHSRPPIWTGPAGAREKGAILLGVGLITFLIVVGLALGGLVFAPGAVLAKDVEYQVVAGKLAVFGHVLDPKYPIPGDDDEGRVIAFHSSPNERWIVIQSGYRVEVDLWLYDTQTKAKPVRIASQPGNHTRVSWHGNRVFGVSWGGMGYRMSELFQVEDPQRGKRIDDMLLYDEGRDIYVSFFIDHALGTGVELGRVFGGQGRKPERFRLNLEYTYASNARFAIEDATIAGNKIVVTHTRESGKKVRETFSSDFLR